jgi:hypothetical protein
VRLLFVTHDLLKSAREFSYAGERRAKAAFAPQIRADSRSWPNKSLDPASRIAMIFGPSTENNLFSLEPAEREGLPSDASAFLCR